MNEYGFEYLFNTEILRRGKEYFRAGAVKRLRRAGDMIEGDVIGSDEYRVAVRFSENGIDEMYCECPHASSGHNCKHEAALLFAVCDTDFAKRL